MKRCFLTPSKKKSALVGDVRLTGLGEASLFSIRRVVIAFLVLNLSIDSNACYLYETSMDGTGNTTITEPIGVWNGPCARRYDEFAQYRDASERNRLFATGRGSVRGDTIEYEGTAKDGVVHGYGKIKARTPNGEINVFEGYVDSGRKITGTERYGDRLIFRGQFDGSHPYRGVMTDGSGRLVHKGGFKWNGQKLELNSGGEDMILALGSMAALVFVSASGALLLGGAARAALASNPSLLLIVAIP